MVIRFSSSLNVDFIFFFPYKVCKENLQRIFVVFTGQSIQTSSDGALVSVNVATPAHPVKPTLPGNTGENKEAINLMKRNM